MASVVIAGDTSGTVTLAAPATAGTTTLTLPTANGTVLTTASTGISASNITTGTLPRAQLPAGSVLQVVSTTKTDTFSTTASSFTDVTGLSVSITPTSSSSKIFVMLSMTISGQNANGGAIYQFVRGSTAICIGDSAGSRQRASGGTPYISDSNVYNTVSGSFLDSPATTSSTTYKVQVVGANAGGGVYINRTQNDTDASNFYNSRTASTITVMEIAA